MTWKRVDLERPIERGRVVNFADQIARALNQAILRGADREKIALARVSSRVGTPLIYDFIIQLFWPIRSRALSGR